MIYHIGITLPRAQDNRQEQICHAGHLYHIIILCNPYGDIGQLPMSTLSHHCQHFLVNYNHYLVWSFCRCHQMFFLWHRSQAEV